MTTTRAAGLTTAEVETYHRDGYVIPDFRLQEEWLARTRAALERLLADNPSVRPELLIGAHISSGGTENVIGHDGFLALARLPEILDRVESVIGPDIVLWGCQVFCKPAAEGREVPWHQDGRYWPIRPPATVTAWIAIDDSTVGNGCMRVLPGSHKAGRHYRHRSDPRPDLALDLVIDEEIDFSCARDVELAAGQMSLHHIGVVHGSAPNHSGRRRAGVAIRYMPASSHFDRDMFEPRTLPNGLRVDFRNRPIWLLRGHDASGKNDFAIGHGRNPCAG